MAGLTGDSDSQTKVGRSCEELHGCSLRSSPSIHAAARSQNPPETSFEVFRNNTTAVEVIVKQLNRVTRNSKLRKSMETCRDPKDLQEEIEKLKYELEKSNEQLLATKKGYRTLVFELKEQLDGATQQDLELQSKYISLNLENDKLRILLETKTNLIVKLKRELSSMKRVLKLAMKGVGISQMPERNNASDTGYDNFEKELKKETLRKEFEGAFMSLNSTMSRELNMNSFDNV